MRLTGFCLIMLGLVGCIEVRDKEDNVKNQPMLKSMVLTEWVIEGEKVLWNGNLVDLKDLKHIQDIKPSTYNVSLKTLRFTRGAVLYTLGSETLLEVEDLISDEGSIVTFPKDQRAAPAVAGRSGGHIYIQASKAQGQLSVVMRGEHGGHGINGAPPDEHLRGANGAEVIGFCPVFSDDRPSRPPPNATSGQPGLKGYAGTSGGNGGNSGILNMVINDRYFIVNVTVESGKGGTGGIGGAGGLGGNPGVIKSVCGASGNPRTAEQLRGPSGDNGAAGVDGSAQKYCLESDGYTECK